MQDNPNSASENIKPHGAASLDKLATLRHYEALARAAVTERTCERCSYSGSEVYVVRLCGPCLDRAEEGEPHLTSEYAWGVLKGLDQ